MRRIPDSAGHSGHDLFLHLSLLMRFFSQTLFFNIIGIGLRKYTPNLSCGALKLDIRRQKLPGYIGQDIRGS